MLWPKIRLDGSGDWSNWQLVLKAYAKSCDVWQFINPDGTLELPEEPAAQNRLVKLNEVKKWMKDELGILQPSLQEQLQVHTALHLEYQAELAAEKQRRPSHKEHMRQILEWIEVTVAPDIYQAALVDMLSSKGDEDFWIAPLSTRDILRGLQKTIGCSEEQDKSGVLGHDEVPLEGVANTIEAIRFAERFGLVRVPSRKSNSNLADNAYTAQDDLNKWDDDDTTSESEQDATEALTVSTMVPGLRQATVSDCVSDDEHRSKDVSTY